MVAVSVDDDQFQKEPASIFIYVNDETDEIEGYLDCSMGRPIPLKAKLKDGKYQLTAIQ